MQMKKVKINRDIYSDRAIQIAMSAYNSYAVMTVSYKKNFAVITFWKCKYDEDQTIKEFENYMIGAENA